MDIALAADDFIRHGTYLRNWSPRTATTYRTGINALCRADRVDGDAAFTSEAHYVTVHCVEGNLRHIERCERSGYPYRRLATVGR